MENWIIFWKAVCIIGFSSFILTVIVIIPLGARDIFRLFNVLGKNRDLKKVNGNTKSEK